MSLISWLFGEADDYNARVHKLNEQTDEADQLIQRFKREGGSEDLIRKARELKQRIRNT